MKNIRRGWKRSLSVVVLACLAVTVASCGNEAGTGSSSNFPNKAIQIMAPAAPGGGWDTTARTVAQVLQEAKIVTVPVEVYNKAGAGGTVGLGELVNAKKGDPYTLMMMGRVMLGAILTNKSTVTLKEVTPLARLTSENEVVVVPADSPHKTMADLVAAMKADPKKVTWAGGSAGGTDHILIGQIALAAGIDPGQINYVAYSGGGEATAAVLGGQVTAGVSGLGEWEEQIKAGKMRALAISGDKRLEGLDIPTLKEAGTDVVLLNWRGIVAPPGISEADKKALQDILTKMHDSQQWKDVLAKNKWDDVFMTDGYDKYLTEEDDTLTKTLTAIGLIKKQVRIRSREVIHRGTSRLLTLTTRPPAMSTRLTIERRLALVIALLSLLVLLLTFQVPEPSTFMPVGPRVFPTVLGFAMLLSAFLLFILPPRQPAVVETEQVAAEHTDAAVVEGVGEAEDEELEWRRVLLLMGLTLVYVLAFSILGFILSTAPFIVAAARILGSRHLVRDIIVGVLVATGIYFLFTELLRVGLPPMPGIGI